MGLHQFFCGRMTASNPTNYNQVKQAHFRLFRNFESGKWRRVWPQLANRYVFNVKKIQIESIHLCFDLNHPFKFSDSLYESKLDCTDACTTSKVGAVPKKDWEEKLHLRVFPGAPKKGTRFERQTLEPSQVLDALIKTIYA